MSSWSEFAREAPDIAAFGAARFGSGVAYLGTLRKDGSPRVHPVTPIIGEQLYLFMEPTSPKGKDLRRDARYTLHCSVADMSGGEGEFYVTGKAVQTSDPVVRAQAVEAAPYSAGEQYILFILSVETAFMNQYVDGASSPRRWKASTPEAPTDVLSGASR
jgi:hypothetical protein